MHSNKLTPLLKDIKDGSEVKKKKHRTTYTQRLSFEELNQSGQRITEQQKVFQLLANCHAMNSRQIFHRLKVERTNITRSLRDLLDQGKIKIACLAKCPTTGKKVQYYTALESIKN
jgi:predicted HTH transcriptional regulator